MLATSLKFLAFLGGSQAAPSGRGSGGRGRSGDGKLTAMMGAYPEVQDSTVTGKVMVRHLDDGSIKMSYRLSGLEANAEGGLHIHSGTTCADASLVGGHYWDSEGGTVADPWTTTYTSDEDGMARGQFMLSSGYGLDANTGHAVVLHAASGARIGCGVLEAPFIRPPPLKAMMGAYPEVEASTVEGWVKVKQNADGSIKMSYRLSGLEAEATGGLHIHTGTSCDDADTVGGHYWDSEDGTVADPWTTTYSSTEDGEARGCFKLDSGYDHDGNTGHAVVLHDSTGARVGCGVLEVTEGRSGGGKKNKGA